MTDRDIDRLYGLIDDLRGEIVGYRADLNGRLKALETADAERRAAEGARGGLFRWAFLAGGFAAAVATVLNIILARV